MPKKCRSFYNLLVLTLILSPIISFSQGMKNSYYYTGSINEKLNISAKISFEDSKISGFYYYTNQGKFIWLDGEYDKNNKFSMNETPYDTITGYLKGNTTDSYKTLKGEWSNPKGDKKFPFIMNLLATEKSIKMKDFEVYVCYPAFVLKNAETQNIFNREIEKYMKEQFDTLAKNIKNDYKEAEDTAAQRDVKEHYSYTMDAYPDYISDNILSVLVLYYTNTGGAHPNSQFLSVNFANNSGKIKKIKLAELFKPNSKYLKYLSDYCINDLKRKQASSVVNGEITDVSSDIKAEYVAFTITSKGLKFEFSPYSVASYAEGAFSVIVPYDKIKNIVDEDGILAEFYKK